MTFYEGACGDVPFLSFGDNDRSIVLERCCELHELRRYRFIGLAFLDEGFEVGVPLERYAEVLLEGNEPVGLVPGDAGGAGELVLVPEDAELTGATAEAHKVTGVRADLVFFEDIPDLLLFPVTDGPEPVDMTEGVLAVPEVGLIGLQDGVLCPLRAFLTPFAGENERTDVLEALVVPQGSRTYIYLQVG